MKKNLFGLILLFSSFLKAQSPQGVTPEAEKKIKESVRKEASDLKESLVKKSGNEVQIEFTIDTFKIEREMEEYIEIDYSTVGMKEAVMIATEKYDTILNKYYKKLLQTLKGEDKKILIKAQKAWLAFRDSETDLVVTISDDKYSGGGTMQGLTEVSEYMELIKNRTIVIFNHYMRATQNY